MAVYQINENIKFTRESLGMTQEELCDGVCSTETLSRIETGKHTPNRTTYKKLMEKMGKSGEKYLPFIRSEDIHVHLEKEKIDTLIKTHNYEELNKILPEFKNKLDLTDMVNKQYLLRIQAVANYCLHNSNIEEYQKELISALRCTIPSYQEGNIPKILFTRQEILILCNIAISYFENSNFETALSILFQIEKYFQNVHIDIAERAFSELLMLSNLAQCLARYGNLEGAEKRVKKAINLSVSGNKSGSLAHLFYNLAYINEVSKKGTDLCQEELIEAYYIAELCKNHIMVNHIKKHIADMYEDNFIDLY